MKQCRECKETKQKIDFTIDKTNKDGIRGVCKKCVNKKKMDKYYAKKNEISFY